MSITLNGTTGITTPAIDNQGNLSVDGGTIKLDGNYPVGTGNVALGDLALSDGSLSGGNNTAVGYNSGANIASGAGNTLTGSGAGVGITTGTNNSYFGVGTAAFDYNTGTANVGLGYQALYKTTASNSTAVGYQAGYGQTTGGENSFFGRQAGYSAAGSTATHNTFIGDNAGSTVTTGSKNTILGRYNGNQGGLDIRTSSNNIVLSDGDGNVRYYIDSLNRHYIGKNTLAVTSIGRVTYPDASTNISTNAGGLFNFYYAATGGAVGSISHSTSATSYNTSSDYRLKENVVYDWDATTRLKQLKPARFNFIVDADTTVDGFLAHEAQAVVPEAVHGTHNEVDADGVAVMQGIDQSKLVPLLVKTIQELEARITALEGN
jgi:hypothetical protein